MRQRQITCFPIYLPNITSTGNRTITVIQLNMSRIVAPANARRNWSLSPACVNETMVLVIDVPMFAPIIGGMANLTSITGTRQNKRYMCVNKKISLNAQMLTAKIKFETHIQPPPFLREWTWMCWNFALILLLKSLALTQQLGFVICYSF